MITTATGLQYDDTTQGDGAEAKKGQSVTVHYTGWLYNDGVQGAKFDSSKDRKDPFVFSLGAGMVIRGWDEGAADLHAGHAFVPAADHHAGAQGEHEGVAPVLAGIKLGALNAIVVQPSCVVTCAALALGGLSARADGGVFVLQAGGCGGHVEILVVF